MPAPARPVAAARTETFPWWCFAVAFGALCIPIGALWDISWHSTIGRDTFWTPAHITIHLGGLVPGLTAGWLAMRSTFFDRTGEGVRLLGLRAPLGAWVIIWGAWAMLLSAPFDDWWHNAYGLDVEILSPPHTVLAAGMYAVALGSLLLVLQWQNRTGAKVGSWLFILCAGILVTMSTIIVTEKSYPNQQQGDTFYKISCLLYPTYLAAVMRAAKVRWAATGAALVYMLIYAGLVWVLPLFRAQPLLAPIYIPVDRMVPPVFPLLLVAPALAMDLLHLAFRQHRGFWWDCLLSILLGAAFCGAFFAVQYNFSAFMLSPQSDNWFFGGHRHWPYFVKPGEWQGRFWDTVKDPITGQGLLLAMGLAMLKSRIALGVGNWMSRVQR